MNQNEESGVAGLVDAVELEMSGEAPRVPLICSPGDLPLPETSELRAAGPVLLAALKPLRDAMAGAAATRRQQGGGLLHLLELAILHLSSLLVHRRPELQMHAAAHPVSNLPLSIPVIKAITWNALAVEDADQLPRIIGIRLH